MKRERHMRNKATLRWGLALLLAGVASSFGASKLAAQTVVTAFKTGERTTGMTKQCFYDALGNEYTRTIQSVQLCPLSIQVPAPPRPSPNSPPPRPSGPRVITAFKKGERTTGMTKQCYYDGLGSLYTRTIGAVELCPLSIQVRVGGWSDATSWRR